MANATQGRKSRLEVSPDNGLTFINVGGLQELNLSGTIDELECTDFDTEDGARAYIPNYHSETASVTANRDLQDAGQLLIANTLTDPETRFKVRVYLKKASGEYRFDALAFVTDYNFNNSRDGLATFDFTLRLSETKMKVQL